MPPDLEPLVIDPTAEPASAPPEPAPSDPPSPDPDPAPADEPAFSFSRDEVVGETPPEPETAPEPAPEPAAPDPIEVEARELGWKPEGEWKGKPPPRGFMSAAEFLETGSAAKARQKRLEENLPRIIEERMRPLVEMQVEAQRRQWEERRASVESQWQDALRDAVGRGDLRAYDQLMVQYRKAMGDLHASSPDAPQQPAQPQRASFAPDVEEYARSWRIENADAIASPVGQRVLAEVMGQVHAEAQAQGYANDPKRVLERIGQRARELRPDLFPAQAAPKPASPTYESGARSVPSAGSEKGYIDLPAEARRQFGSFVKQGVFQDSKEDRAYFAREYWSAAP